MLRRLEARTFIEKDGFKRKVVKSKEGSTKGIIGDGLGDLHISFDVSQIQLAVRSYTDVFGPLGRGFGRWRR